MWVMLPPSCAFLSPRCRAGWHDWSSGWGTTLFDRHGRSLSLNVRGKALRSRIRAAVTQLDLAESEVRRCP